jgi:hypothetical protein
VTHEHSDSYTISYQAASATVSADTGNTGGNSRDVFWREPANLLNAQSCATWTSDSDPFGIGQQGAALRIRTTGGRVRAVTVTKNIWGGAAWVFNLHTWDSKAVPNSVQIGQVDLSATFHRNGVIAPLPWHLCAKAVGNTLSFIAWPSGEPIPTYGDPTHGGSATIPAGWDVAGKAGWYAGHVHPGALMGFSDMTSGLVNG